VFRSWRIVAFAHHVKALLSPTTMTMAQAALATEAPVLTGLAIAYSPPNGSLGEAQNKDLMRTVSNVVEWLIST
jgi:hypothetical protein